MKLRYESFQHKIDDGQIVMVNSMSGHRVAPGKLRFYSATKFAVTGLLEGWRQEVNDSSAKYFQKAFLNIKSICASIGQNHIPIIFLKLRSMDPPNNIRVAQLCPGLVKTEFQEVAFGKENTVFSNMEKPLVADDMANSIKFIIEAPAHVQIHDIMVRPTSQFY